MNDLRFWLRHGLWRTDQAIATFLRWLQRKPPRVPEHPSRLARPFRTGPNSRHENGPLVSVVAPQHTAWIEQTFGDYETVSDPSKATGRYVVRADALASPTALELAVFHAELHGTASAPNTPIARREGRSAPFGVRMTTPFVNMLGEPERAEPQSLLVMMPFTVMGGAEGLLRTVLAGLVARGWRVALVTTRSRLKGAKSTKDWFEAITPHVFDLPHDVPDSADWADFLDYLLASRRVGRLLIVGSHFGYLQLPRIKSAREELKVFDLLFNETAFVDRHFKHLAHFDGTLVESEHMARVLTRRGEPRDGIAVIPSGIDLARYKPGRTDLRERIGAREGDVIVGYSGRWSPEKAPLDFVAIANTLRDDRIQFVMTGGGVLDEKVRKAAARLRLPPDRFHILGNVSDLSAIIAGYDLLVLPSRVDGRPLVVMEALASGVPVIASRVGALPELIRDGENGALCDAGDIAGFAEEIAMRVARPDILRAQKQAARARAEEEFDLSRMVDEYERALLGTRIGTDEPPE